MRTVLLARRKSRIVIWKVSAQIASHKSQLRRSFNCNLFGMVFMVFVWYGIYNGCNHAIISELKCSGLISGRNIGNRAK